MRRAVRHDAREESEGREDMSVGRDGRVDEDMI